MSSSTYTRMDMLKLWRPSQAPAKPLPITHDLEEPSHHSSSHHQGPERGGHREQQQHSRVSSDEHSQPVSPIQAVQYGAANGRRQGSGEAGGAAVVGSRASLGAGRNRMGSASAMNAGVGVMGVLSGVAPGVGGLGSTPHTLRRAESKEIVDASARPRQDSAPNISQWSTRPERKDGPLRSDVPVWRRGLGPLPAPSARRPGNDSLVSNLDAEAVKSPPMNWDEDEAKVDAKPLTMESLSLNSHAFRSSANRAPPVEPEPLPVEEKKEMTPASSVVAARVDDSFVSFNTSIADDDDPLLRREPANGPLGASANRPAPPPGFATPQISPEASIWSYRDPSGQTQGPFTSVQMNDWFHASYFSLDLLITSSHDPRGQNLFEPLGVLINRVGDRQAPFFAALRSAQSPPLHHMPPNRAFTTNYDPFSPPPQQQPSPIHHLPSPPQQQSFAALDPFGFPVSQSTPVPPSPWDQSGLQSPAPASLLSSLRDDSAVSRQPSWPPQPQSSLDAISTASPWSTLPPIGPSSSSLGVRQATEDDTVPILNKSSRGNSMAPIGTPPVFLSPTPSVHDLSKLVEPSTSITDKPDLSLETDADDWGAPPPAQSSGIEGWSEEPEPIAEPVKKLPQPTATVRKSSASTTARWANGRANGGPAPTVSPTTSLRDIQAREAKLAEEQKAAAAAERERERRAAEAAAIAAAEADVSLPSSSQWGDAPSPSAAAAVPAKPAWSQPAKAPVVRAGLSLKEIQADEARKAQAAAVRRAANTAAASATGRAGYASSVGTGPGWTTVGKTAATVAAPIASPPALSKPAAGTATVVRPTSVNVGATRTATAPNLARRVSQAAPIVDGPPPPSAELRKWIKTSLQGLSANLDEFTQMLLSFPLDPDTTVVEIISDSVYANSTSLDGRRWTAEWIKRRKDDANKQRPAPVVTVKPAAQSSMADALRAPPKPQPDPFKVVVKQAHKAKRR